MANETNQRIEGNEGDSGRYPHRVMPNQAHDQYEQSNGDENRHYREAHSSPIEDIRRHIRLQNYLIALETKEALLEGLTKAVYHQANQKCKRGIFTVFNLRRKA